MDPELSLATFAVWEASWEEITALFANMSDKDELFGEPARPDQLAVGVLLDLGNLSWLSAPIDLRDLEVVKPAVPFLLPLIEGLEPAAVL